MRRQYAGLAMLAVPMIGFLGAVVWAGIQRDPFIALIVFGGLGYLGVAVWLLRHQR